LEEFDGRAWGIPLEGVEQLGARLQAYWERYRGCFKTRTRDGSVYAYAYLSGELRMDTDRNFANIARQTGQAGQNVQHFMSVSPWAVEDVYRQIAEEIRQTPALRRGGVLILDESAEEKAGDQSVGAQRQHNGRLGKVELSQVGVFVAYGNLTGPTPVWTWVSGDLFLPEAWLAEGMAECRVALGVPEQATFRTKPEIGWALIRRQIQEYRLPVEVVCCDTLYGRSTWLRAQFRGAGLPYMAEVPCDTQVYLRKPRLGVPRRRRGHGRAPTRVKVLSADKPVEVRTLVAEAETVWRRLTIRATERGLLQDEFAARRVWTVYAGQAVAEWLVMRKEPHGRVSYALSHASRTPSLEQLAWWKCQRYLVERSNEDAKSELGWDEFQAQKYLAWQHHVALTVLASWFVAQTKLEWAQMAERDPAVVRMGEVDVLPALSMANVRTLLQAVLPLPQLTPPQATNLVIEHLINRTRSRKSRMKHPAPQSCIPPPEG